MTTKAALIDFISNKAGASKAETTRILDALGDVVGDLLNEGNEVTLPGIGKLTVKEKAARTGRNPKTGEPIEIPARKAAHFSAAKALKDALAK